MPTLSILTNCATLDNSSIKLLCVEISIDINVYNPRPHPNECSGSDLDGDIYFVCWDPELIPSQQISPMDYTPEPPLQLDHDVTIEVFLYM